MTTATKIKVANILIFRAEGPANLCIKTIHTTWASAESRIMSIRSSITHDGYDKCDFKIAFEDGETYEGRYDAKRMDSPGEYGLAMHVRSHLQFMTGEACPVHLTKDRYDAVIRRYKNLNPNHCEDAKAVLDTYALED